MKGRDFIKTNNDKVKLIVNAALEEFTRYGLEKASLNKILKSAGISKGGFYHHFKDKQELFEYLLEFLSQLNYNLLEKGIDWDNSDILLRICEISKTKLSYAEEYPYMIEFTEKFSDILFTEEKKNELGEWRKKIYCYNIDESLFREGISLIELLQIARWTYKGLYLEMLKTKGCLLDQDDIQRLYDECDHYYGKLKLVLYK